MDSETRLIFNNLKSPDKNIRYQAFMEVLKVTERPVDWAYEVWDELITNLSSKDNHVRARATQMLCNLAVSDPEKRIQRDFEKIMAVTKDERFVTARHTLQSIWKIGKAGPDELTMVLDGLELRFTECSSEKNFTLIRSDIIQGFKNLAAAVEDEKITDRALKLINKEVDPKSHLKLTKLWKRIKR
ncbi:hypothetical protein ACFLXB_07185 [Chloroflexota bacterium]